MAKLTQKSVDVNQVLVHPKQTWTEKVFAWTKSKPVLSAIFVTLLAMVSSAFAQEGVDAWNTPLSPVAESYSYSRRAGFILVVLALVVAALLVLFRKISWRWILFAATVLALLFLSFQDWLEQYSLIYSYAPILSFILWFVPPVVSFIQYAHHKIDKACIKRRLLTWAGLTIAPFVLIFVIALCIYLFE